MLAQHAQSQAKKLTAGEITQEKLIVYDDICTGFVN